ncbi:MAG: GAF domain-containing protein [Phormidesmis sp.]
MELNPSSNLDFSTHTEKNTLDCEQASHPLLPEDQSSKQALLSRITNRIHSSKQALLNRITNRVRESLELTEILSATAAEVRNYLGTDRVKIYQFMPGHHGWVIAEALNEGALPSLKGLHFPADDIPAYARELYLRERQRTIVNFEQKAIGISQPLDYFSHDERDTTDIAYRPIDPCHLEYLSAMGVKSSVVVPIILDTATSESQQNNPTEHTEKLWGLLVSHHATSRTVTEEEISFIQSVVDQVSVAISQSILLEKVRAQARREADVNRITAVLYTDATIQLQQALEETVDVYQGVGGRIYLFNIEDHLPAQVYFCGQQPTPLPGKPVRPVEEHALWQKYLISTLEHDLQSDTESPWSVSWMKSMYGLGNAPEHAHRFAHIWAIADIYTEPLFRSLTPRFQDTDVRGVLVCPFRYGKRLLGCLSIFRSAIDEETVWAGHHTPDERQLTPRQSFEAWRQLSKGQAQAWSLDEIRLMDSLTERFAAAMKQTQLTLQIQSLNEHLTRQVDVRTSELAQSTMLVNQQRTLASILANLQKPLNVKTLFKTATQAVQQLLEVDRVAVYRFDKDWGGEFIDEFGTVSSGWAKIILATRNIWNDSYLQDTAGGRYRNGEISVVHDIYEENLSPCHIEVLENYYIRAYIIVPLFLGEKLWGLLGVYQHEKIRIWDDSEASFLTQLATHLAVALQQGKAIKKVQAQASELATIAEQQRTMNAVIGRIRQSLDLTTIFETTTHELRTLFNVDRVVIYKFLPTEDSGSGRIVFENVKYGYSSILDITVEEHCFIQKHKIRPNHTSVFAINDVANDALKDCHRKMLTDFQITANLVVPLFNGEKIWGLLCLNECAGNRDWSSKEKEFASQIATQLGVAIQQAQLLSDAESARISADAASQAKSRFLATMSHELRTPLNAILGMVQLCKRDETLTETQTQKLLTIGKSGEHLLTLINNVLEMSRIEAGRETLEERAICLPTFLTGLGDMLENEAAVKGLQLIVELADELPKYIRVDDSKLRQILINLLGNALKFTQQGTVKLKACTIEGFKVEPPRNTSKKRDNLTLINFIVQDTGPGIAAQDLNVIFEAFGQSETGLNSQEGTGLGLTISRQFVSLMGGELTVESEVGVGSKFEFFIQAEQVAKSEYEAQLPTTQIVGLAADQPAPHILIVEDKEANRQLVSELLKTIGFEVREAVNGEDAIAVWKDWQPHLILMDLRMPVMDGYEATRQIRQLAQDSSPVIIALTANAFEEDRQRALNAGCDDFVRKPYEEQNLLETIGRHLGLRYCDQDKNEVFMAPVSVKPDNVEMEGAVDRVSGNPTRPMTPLNILVAEDDAQNRVFMEEMLTHLGHHVTLVKDGEEAVETFPTQEYDLVMCDLHMPKLTGIEVAHLVRKHGTTSQPMIVGVTGSSMQEELDACYQAGMDKILMKPLKFETVESLLESLQQSRKLPSPSPSPSKTDESDESSVASKSAIKVEENASVDCIEQPESELSPATLDYQYFFDNYQQAFGKNAPGKIVARVEAFLAKLPDRLEEIQTMISEANHEQVRFLSHNLKGVVHTYGATELAEVCQTIEHEAKESSSPNYQSLLKRFETESERFKLALLLELQHYREKAEDNQLSVAG